MLGEAVGVRKPVAPRLGQPRAEGCPERTEAMLVTPQAAVNGAQPPMGGLIWMWFIRLCGGLAPAGTRPGADALGAARPHGVARTQG